MAAIPADLDPNDPINILLRPFDAIPKAAATTSGADPNAQALADAQASQAALDAAAAAEAERQRKLAEEKANALRSQTVGGKGNITQFGGAEGEVVYESNVRPSGRRWEPSNRVEVKRTVLDFTISDPVLPAQIIDSSLPSVLSPASGPSGPSGPSGTSGPSGPSPVSFSQPIQVEMVTPVAAAVAKTGRPRPPQQQQQQQPQQPQQQQQRPRVASSPKPKPAPAAAATAVPATFSPTAGVHPTTNATEELMRKVKGDTKVRQCPSFRMLEFQIQYEDYKQTKTAVS